MTIITFPLSEVRPSHPHIRRFDVRRDMRAVADLVERCFAETLDADGRRTIDNMRSQAMNPQFLRWVSGVGGRPSGVFGGFVWEQDGAIVGNLSLIPMPSRKRKTVLIANVAVDEAFRRRGIARALTQAAIEEAGRRAVDDIWLHVRTDNPGALALYRRLGFIEQTRRTAWQDSGRAETPENATDIHITAPQRRDWSRQLSWLERLHPEELDWYLSLDARELQPGLIGAITRILRGVSPRSWAAYRGRELLGTVSRQHTMASSDRLWLAAPKEPDEPALHMLLAAVRAGGQGRKPLLLEYPAGQATGALENSGFVPHHTLIWMKRGG